MTVADSIAEQKTQPVEILGTLLSDEDVDAGHRAANAQQAQRCPTGDRVRQPLDQVDHGFERPQGGITVAETRLHHEAELGWRRDAGSLQSAMASPHPPKIAHLSSGEMLAHIALLGSHPRL